MENQTKVMNDHFFISGLGFVPKCTLPGSFKTVSYGNKSYCMVYMGRKSQNLAMYECKMLNATLPLPKSKGEADEFRKITGTNPGNSTWTDYVWMGIRDTTKSSDKSKWKDVEGNQVGNAYVNLRVINLSFNSKFL